jgi:hypothetical protein
MSVVCALLTTAPVCAQTAHETGGGAGPRSALTTSALLPPADFAERFAADDTSAARRKRRAVRDPALIVHRDTPQPVTAATRGRPLPLGWWVEIGAHGGGIVSGSNPRLGAGQWIGLDPEGHAGLSADFVILGPNTATAVRFGFAFDHFGSSITEVRNVGGGGISASGNFDADVFRGKMGVQFAPFDRTHPLAFLTVIGEVGAGVAWNDVLLRGPLGNVQLTGSGTSTVFTLRGELRADVTNYLGIGIYGMYTNIGSFNGLLASGAPIEIGGRDNVTVGMFAVLRAMRAPLQYANVHTDRFPGGEIRGQLRFSEEN